MAGAGRLIRDVYEHWIAGFAKDLGVASALVAKLWETLLGLQLAWDFGYRKVFLEIDSEVVCRIARGKEGHAAHTASLMLAFRSLLSRDWQVQISHTYQERNSCADWLARWTLGFS